ncbi:hypothetical protein JWS13_26905 [Rhodococcus pseudokoreensis]|uniref:Uncharacterized protein n=1 Tax=Rhodococcus pseudokoreensis TaxID=2811421 RepID=A0A974W694_9NOCA|nr:hypothetical protein [Rhodococcus pseudokoreensis]QSE92010.1 hypothetical protein JWS13_26905 [Rhodococcus pseudokoreensis]
MNSRTEVLAQVRGAVVGSSSGAVSIAAHGMAGGGMPPNEASVVLLLVACAAVGAAVAALRITGRDGLVLVAALATGQLIGHTTLGLAGEHAHGLGLSTPMIAAHLAAIAVSAALVRGAERACLRALAAVTRIVLAILTPAPVRTATWSATPVYRAKLSLRLLVGSAAGTRGPPALV